MKNLLRFLLLTLLSYVCLPPPLAHGQLVGPKSITSTQLIQIDTNGLATVAINVTGTWTGTLQPQGTIGGQAAFNVQVSPAGSISPASTITANGAYVLAVSGLSSFQLVGNTVATGTAVVYLNGSIASSGSGSSGGGGGGGGTGNGLAIALAGATAPSPVATSTCPGNPAIWSQNAAGTYQTEAAVDPSQALVGSIYNSPGFLTFCRPIFFNSSGATSAITFNGIAYNIFGVITASPDHHFAAQEEFGMAVGDTGNYTTGNISVRYSEMYFQGTPTISTTHVANSRLTFEDVKTGGSKPRVWSAVQGVTRKSGAYDITNCTGGIDGATNGSCYVAFYGESSSIVAAPEDQTGASYAAFEGYAKDANNRALNATGYVFHALVQGSTGNRFVNNIGFGSEDFGSGAGYYTSYHKGTATTGFHYFGGPIKAGGSAGHATHAIDADTLGIGSSNQTAFDNTGKPTTDQSITTAGLGHPIQAARVRSVAQTSAIGTTTLLTAGAATTDYLLVATLYCTATSAAATAQITITYTDPGSQTQTITPTAAGCTALGVGSYELINSPIVALAASNIQYAVVIANTPTYDLRIDLYQLGTN